MEREDGQNGRRRVDELADSSFADEMARFPAGLSVCSPANASAPLSQQAPRSALHPSLPGSHTFAAPPIVHANTFHTHTNKGPAAATQTVDSAFWPSFDASGMSGLFPASLSSWSLPHSHHKVQHLDRMDAEEQHAVGHDWTEAFAGPCSAAPEHERSSFLSAADSAWKPEHVYGNLEGGQQRGPGDRAFLAASDMQPTSPIEQYDGDFQDPTYRIVRFDHCKPASVGVGVFFEKVPASELIRVVRLQVRPSTAPLYLCDSGVLSLLFPAWRRGGFGWKHKRRRSFTRCQQVGDRRSSQIVLFSVIALEQ